MKTVYLLAVVALAGLAACGGGDSDTGSAGVTAAEADSPKEVMAVLEDQMVRIADAVEKVEDETSAQTAATIIRDASTELEYLSATVEQMSSMQQARLAMNYSEGLIDAQTRLAVQIQRLSQNDAEYLHMISDAMDELPSLTE